MGSLTGRRLTSAYALAHFGKSLFWCSGELVFAYFLTDVAGLSAWAMALVMGCGMTANAILDIMIGHHLTKTRLTLAKAGRAQQAGSVASTIALLMLCVCSYVPEPLRVAYALVTMLAFRTTYALYDVPQNAMLVLATADAEGRRQVAALRVFFSGAAAIVVATATALLIFLDADDRRFASAVGATVFASVALATASALRRRTRDLMATTGPIAEEMEATQAHRHAFRLPSLLLAMLLISFATAVFSKLEPYYVSLTAQQGLGAGMLIIVGALGGAVSQPLWLLLGRSSQSHSLYMPMGLLLAALTMFGFAAPLGVLAQLGSVFLFGIASGGIGQRIWAAYADSVSARVDPARTALAFGIFTGVAKFGIAASAILAGAALTSGAEPEHKLIAVLIAMVAVPILCIATAWGALMMDARPRPLSPRWT